MWAEIPRDEDGHFATCVAGQATCSGPRFVVERSGSVYERRVRVLTDRLGTFQAFIAR